MIGAELLTFTGHGDDRGQLVVAEAGKNIPFDLKRIFYIYGTAEDTRRGQHAHRVEQQVLICVAGSCKVEVDDGSQKECFLLDKPETALYLASDLWREMYDFAPGTVLLVLSSTPYDSTDYIRDYGEFLKFKAQEAQH